MLKKPILSTKIPPKSLSPWLYYQQSLTERLHIKAGDTLLKIIGSTWESANTWDKTMLNLDNDLVLHREIVMYAWDEPCWYARTILPFQTFIRDESRFKRLDCEPLGSLIFNDPLIQRAWIAPYPIVRSSPEYQWLTPTLHAHVPELWARLSMFVLKKQAPFFLLEVLLPGLARYAD